MEPSSVRWGLWGVRNGLEADFDAYVQARYAGLLRAALVLCRDRHSAEDLVQTALMRAHRSWRRVREADDPDAYVHRILINASRSWFRRSWHAGPLPAAEPSGADAHAHADLRDALVRALGALPAAQREALVLRYLTDLSEAATARALGCSVGTVKSRTSRGLAALRAGGLLTDPMQEAHR